MRYEEREVCFAPVFAARGFITCVLFNLLIVPALLSLLIPFYLLVVLVTLGRLRPRQEVSCAIKRVWYVATHCGTGNDDAALVL